MRVYATLDDQIVAELDGLAGEKGVKRTQLVVDAVNQYLHPDQSGAVPSGQTSPESMELKGQLNSANQEKESLRAEIEQLKAGAVVSGSEDLQPIVDQLRSDLDIAHNELSELLPQLETLKAREAEIQAESDAQHNQADQLKRQLDQSNRELESLKLAQDHLHSQRDEKRAEAESLRGEAVKLREEIQNNTYELDKLREVIKTKDAEISFLRSHIHELSQKLIAPSLPGSKPWWQFWR
jgi:chromosome segregation ATPase